MHYAMLHFIKHYITFVINVTMISGNSAEGFFQHTFWGRYSSFIALQYSSRCIRQLCIAADSISIAII